MCAMALIERSEPNFWEWVLSFYQVCLKGRTQMTWSGLVTRALQLAGPAETCFDCLLSLPSE